MLHGDILQAVGCPPLHIKGLSFFFILHQLNTHEQAFAPYIPHHRVMGQLFPPLLEKVLAEPGTAFHQPFFLQNIDNRQAGGCRDGVALHGEAMHEAGARLRKHLPDLFIDNYHGHWRIASRHPFGRGDDIGIDAPVINAEPLARPAKAADDLIIDEQHFVLIANLADYGVIFRNRHHAGGSGAAHCLHKEGGHILRADLIDNLLKRPGALYTAARIGELVGAVVA